LRAGIRRCSGGSLLRGGHAPVDCEEPVVGDDVDRDLREVDLAGIAEPRLDVVLLDPVRTGDDAEERHEVLRPADDRARRHVALVEPLGRGIVAGVRDEAAGRLVPERPVEEGRHADRTADVRAEPEDRPARADDRALAARAASGGARRVVGVVRPPPHLVVALHPHAELADVRDA